MVGSALRRLGIKRKFMVDYVDFLVAELLLKSGYPAGQTDYTEENIRAVQDAIFSNPEIVRFLKKSPRSLAHKEKNLTSIQAGLQNWKLLPAISEKSN